jgi:hypothetical protein
MKRWASFVFQLMVDLSTVGSVATEGDNEKNEPDVQYEWRKASSAWAAACDVVEVGIIRLPRRGFMRVVARIRLCRIPIRSDRL